MPLLEVELYRILFFKETKRVSLLYLPVVINNIFCLTQTNEVSSIFPVSLLSFMEVYTIEPRTIKDRYATHRHQYQPFQSCATH